jgi:hypothetical protein
VADEKATKHSVVAESKAGGSVVNEEGGGVRG